MDLIDVCELIVDCEHKTAPTQDKGHPSIRTPNIGRGYLILDGVNRVSEETYKLWTKRAIPQAGDLIMAREAPAGNVAVIPPGLHPCLGQRTLLIRPDRNQVDGNFLNYYLNGPFVQGLIHAKTNGATVPHLNMKDVRSLPVPSLPPLPIQRRIAGILSAYDDLIENSQRRIKILEEMARRLYREWFVHFRFPGHEDCRSVESPLGEIPEGWEVKSLGEIADNFDRLRKPLSKIQRAELQGPYPYYGAAKALDYVKDFIFDGEYLLMAEDGSVITSDRAPVLQLANERFWPNNHTHVLKGRPPFSTHYLYLGLLCVDISPYITGAAQPKITQENMNRIPFACAPVSVHQEFDRLVEPIIRQGQTLQCQISSLRRTRDLLLPRLLSGQIDVEALPEPALAKS